MKSKRYLPLIILTLLVCSFFAPLLNVWQIKPVFAAGITRIQTQHFASNAVVLTYVITLDSAPVSGNVIILTFTSYDTSYVTVIAITESNVGWSANGAGLQKRTQILDGSAHIDSEIWLGMVNAGASATITVHISAYSAQMIMSDACEYSNVSATSFLDKTAFSSGSMTTSPVTGTTSATSQADELFVGVIGAFNSTASVAQSNPTNSFTLINGTDESFTAGYLSSGYLEYMASSTTTANSGVTLANACTIYAACIATFTAAIPDVTPPTFNTITSNTTLAGNGTQVTCWIADPSDVSAWRFAWNNSGSWVNSSAYLTSGPLLNQRWNGTWNGTSGESVQVQFWANDTLNNAGYSSIHTFITTSSYSLAYMLGALAGEVNWQKSVYTYYVGYQFGECSLAQLQAAIDAIPNLDSATYNYVGAYAWQSVLYWYVTCAKYGIENETTIKWALNSASMLTTTGLPTSETTYFSSYDRYLLYGYYYAQKYDYLTSKWNITTAYNTLKLSINNTYHSFRLLYGVNDTSGTYRYYDEEAETMDCFVTLYSLGVSDALTEATLIYSYLVSNYYGSSSYGYYFGYTGSGTQFECEAGGFLQLCEKLWYNYPTLTDITDVLTDLQTRFISLQWNSPQWDWAAEHFPAIVLHARYANGTIATNQSRLANTLMAWAAIYGAANSFTAAEYSNMTQMLLGTGATASTPAWNLTYNSLGSFIGFKLFSDSATITNESTVMGMTLMALQGVVPTNTSLAIPLQENHYEDIANLGDHDLFNINLTGHTLTISLVDSGNVTFLYGSTPVNYTFTNGQGTYLIQFASDWNSIISVISNGALPTNRIYLFETTPVTVTVAVTAPESITYTSGTISVTLAASGGTIDKEWYNVKNGTSWVYASNQTYTSPTSMTGFSTGTYTFYGWANNTAGTVGETTVSFTVLISTGGTYLFDPLLTWLLPAYNTTVAFSQPYRLNSFYWDTANTTIYFYNFSLGSGASIDFMGFSSQTANMTVTHVIEGNQKIDYTVDAATTSAVYYGAGIPSSATYLGMPVAFTFDGVSKTTVTTTGAGIVEIDYSATPPPPTNTYTLTVTVNPALDNVQMVINETSFKLPHTFTSAGAYTWLVSSDLSTLQGSTIYDFYNWIINGTIVESSNLLWLYNTGNTTLVANYAASGSFVLPTGGTPVTFYFRENIVQSRGKTGFSLGTSSNMPNAMTDGVVTDSGGVPSTYGFRAYVVNYNNNTKELTPGYPVPLLMRSVNGSGILTGYWNMTSTYTGSAYGIVDALAIEVYQRWSSGDWQLRGTFVSDPGQNFKLAQGTWSFSFYTSYIDYGTSTLSSYSWGDPPIMSGVTLYTLIPTEFEMQEYYLSIGNLVGFTMEPFVYPLRAFNVNLAYSLPFAILLLIFGITLWIRNESLTATAIVFMLFGGTGGILTGFIPVVGLGVAWVFFAFGIAILFFRLVKGRGYSET